MFAGQQGLASGKWCWIRSVLEQSRGIIKHIPQELTIPSFFALLCSGFYAHLNHQFLSCPVIRLMQRGLRCRLKDIWTGRTLKRRNDKGGRGRRRRAREYYHLVLQSRFGELEFVTLVVHIHYSKEPALSSSHLHNPSRVSQWASLSNKW
jgi:hypothetical protein